MVIKTQGKAATPLAAYGALAAVDLFATAKRPRGLARAAKPLLMPALGAYAARKAGTGTRNLPLLAGLGCATVGDTALLFDDHEKAFLTGMAAFLGTQVSYTAGMAVQLGAVRGARRRPRRAVACLAAWAVANAALAPALDRRMRLPVAGYSLALTAMGAAAFGVGGKVGAGAAAFLVSDLLIGLQAAGHQLPSRATHEVLVMAGYLAGQYLIAAGWLERTAAA